MPNYLMALRSVFLISQAKAYPRIYTVRLRNPEKIYVRDSGLRNAIIGRLSENLLTPLEELGLLAESVVNDHAHRLAYNLNPSGEPEIFYWQDKKGNEVDVVFEIEVTPVCVEVKFGMSAQRKKGGFDRFLRKFPSSIGILITEGKYALSERSVEFPLWLFLLAT